jgi:hypothetical protein
LFLLGLLATDPEEGIGIFEISMISSRSRSQLFPEANPLAIVMAPSLPDGRIPRNPEKDEKCIVWSIKNATMKVLRVHLRFLEFRYHILTAQRAGFFMCASF